jgi:predicted dehydrogenase
VYKDAGTMMESHHPDILVIATHPDSHEKYCALAAACKIPVVICEKPLADTLARARRIAALERSGALKIITNHERRYAEDYVRAKAVLDEGKLGRLLSISATLYMGKTRRLLDVLWHDGTHLADAIMYLTSSVMVHEEHWGAKLSAKNGTAWLGGRLLCPAVPGRRSAETVKQPAGTVGVPFVMEIGAGRDHLVFEISFSCELGRLRIGNGIFDVWESAESPYAEGFRSLRKTPQTFKGPTGYFANMLRDALSCVRDPALRPRSSAADGLRVIEYLHYLY